MRRKNGALVQLVVRYTGSVEVRSSSLLCSTTYHQIRTLHRIRERDVRVYLPEGRKIESARSQSDFSRFSFRFFLCAEAGGAGNRPRPLRLFVLGAWPAPYACDTGGYLRRKGAAAMILTASDRANSRIVATLQPYGIIKSFASSTIRRINSAVM